MDIANQSKQYRSDEHLVFSCQYHVIFCPKYRRKVLCNGLDERFKDIVLMEQARGEYIVLEMEVMPDHVHLLLDVSPRIGVFKTVCHIKGLTSRILRKEYPSLKTRMPSLWTRSSFISTVGSVSLDVVRGYIENQKRNP